YYVRPNFRFGRVSGVSFALLYFEYSKGKRVAALRELLRTLPNHVGRQVEAPTRGLLVIHGSAHELDEAARAAASVPGIREVTLRTLLREVDAPGFPDWLSERIERRSAASKGRHR
ncbi:MAG TPA: hypothetical protein VNP71_05605, partial [Thermoplasmata archaeon]|nr:hypothetical protein [Thermoplasmata archaeon]